MPNLSHADLQDGDYTYTVTDGKANITAFNYLFSGLLSITNTLGGCPVVGIEGSAFRGCSDLTAVNIPDSIISIGDEAFVGCYALTNVFIGSGVTNMGSHPFGGCGNLTGVDVSSSNVAFCSSDGAVIDKIQNALILCPENKSDCLIPDGVTSIGNGAFYGCYLDSVTISSSVTNIGGYAFFDCPLLTSVIIPTSVISIGSKAFSGCSRLTNVTIGASVKINKYTDRHIFESCDALTSVTFFNDLSDITVQDFSIYSHIQEIIIGEGVSSIGPYFIQGAESTLTDLIIGNNVTNIGDRAFSYCSSLTKVMIGSSVATIGSYAFSNCSSLTNIAVPNSVTSIGDCAFQSCSDLTSIAVPNSVTNIGSYAFSGCSRLTAVVIGTGVTSIGDCAFQSCSELTSVTIPDSVTSIGDYAFEYCDGLTGVTIPGSVTNFGNNAFNSCFDLTRVLFTGDAPTNVSSSVFSSTPATIYYRPGTTGWGTTFAGRPTLCWNPTVQQDASFGFTSTRFGFNIVGTTNIPVVVQATANLSSGVWTPLFTNNLGITGSLYFSDQFSTNWPSRFYRIAWP